MIKDNAATRRVYGERCCAQCRAKHSKVTASICRRRAPMIDKFAAG